MRTLKIGDRVRLKVHSLFSRKGKTGTVIETRTDTVRFLKDQSAEFCDACHHEVAKMRDQTPNPEHSRYLLERGLV